VVYLEGNLSKDQLVWLFFPFLGNGGAGEQAGRVWV